MKKRMTHVIVVLVVAVGALAISKNIYPYSKLEVWVLHQMYSRGSGWDDAAFQIISRNPQRYAPQIQRMLDRADPGSGDEKIALAFVEFVIEQPGIRDSLRRRGENHPDRSPANLISAILEGPPKGVPIVERDGVSATLIVPEDDSE